MLSISKPMQKLTDWLSLVGLTVAIFKFLYFWDYTMSKFFHFYLCPKHMIFFFLIKFEKDFWEISLFSVRFWQKDKEKHCSAQIYFTTSIQFCHMGSAGFKSWDKRLPPFFPHRSSKMGTVCAISSGSMQQSSTYIHMLPEKITPLLCESTDLLLIQTWRFFEPKDGY